MAHNTKRFVDKSLLSNILRHHDVHNRVREERDTWRLYRIEKQRRPHVVQRERERCSRRRRSYSDSPKSSRDAQKRNSPSFFWTQQLMDIELNDPDRWGHSGYKDMYPEEFGTKPQATDEHDSPSHKARKRKQEGTKSSSKTKRKKKKEKKAKKKKRKVKKREAKSDRSDSDENTDNSESEAFEETQRKVTTRISDEGHIQQSNSSNNSDMSSDLECTEKGSHQTFETKSYERRVCEKTSEMLTWTRRRRHSEQLYYSDSECAGGGKKTRWKTSSVRDGQGDRGRVSSESDE